MTSEQKAVRTLTRCGPYSERGAERFVEQLLPAEVAELAQLDDLYEQQPHFKQGGRFADVLDNIADRQSGHHDRKAAEAAESHTEAQSTQSEPLVGTGEP